MGLFYNYEHYKFLDEGVPDENIYTHYGKFHIASSKLNEISSKLTFASSTQTTASICSG